MDDPTPNTPTSADAEARLAIIAAALEQVRAIAASATDAQQQAASASQDAQTKAADIAAIARDALAAKTQIGDAQAVIATKSEHIQGAQEHADKVRADLDRALTAATQQTTEAEAQRARAEAAAAAANNALAEFKAARAAVDQEAAAIATARRTAEESMDVTKKLAEKASGLEAMIGERTLTLLTLEKEAKEVLDRIKGLLPDATAAGLSAAFDERRRSFKRPYVIWQSIFVLSVLSIVALTAIALWQTYKTGHVPDWGELARLWLTRLPVVGALIWLALHAGHESGLSKRLEEDYGYKVAVSRCLEGFKKQMSDVQSAPDTPLGKLLSNTLETIAAPPGRIYDKHELSASISKELARVARVTAEAAKAVKSGNEQKPNV